MYRPFVKEEVCIFPAKTENPLLHFVCIYCIINSVKKQGTKTTFFNTILLFLKSRADDRRKAAKRKRKGRPMKYEEHNLNRRKLPFIFRDDEMNAGEKDYTHWHENLEILYFYDGEGLVTTDFRPTRTEQGDVFVINSEKLHMVESASRAHPVRYYCLILDSDFCRENGIPVTDLRFVDRISGDTALEKLFLEVARAYGGSGEYKDAAIRAAALNLLLALVQNYRVSSEEEPDVDDLHLENVKEAVKYIKENYEKPMSVGQVARAAGLSSSYFSRIFKSVTGYTIVSYINLVRCRNAAKLLSSGKYKVGEAAVQCGFENLSYFTRTYKQIMGVLPSGETKTS